MSETKEDTGITLKDKISEKNLKISQLEKELADKNTELADIKEQLSDAEIEADNDDY